MSFEAAELLETEQTVFIIDDDDAVRDAMGMLMATSNIPYKKFSDGNEFLEQYDDNLHGCLVVDIRMPGLSGLELQQELNRRGSILPMIFITGHGDIPMAVEAMRRGALDFMRKPIKEGDLIRRVKDALSVETDSHRQRGDHRQAVKLLSQLTEREHEVFELVSNGETNKSISGVLNISERTVEVHRANVMKKLEANTLAHLVRLRIAFEQN